MKKIAFVLSMMTLLAAAPGQARQFSRSGCGLGTLVMGKDGNQILSATTNGTFGSQTFGITSGTSNCTDDGAVASNQEMPLFVETNRVALESDIARGSGETLASLSVIMGCSNAAQLASALQANYQVIFSSAKAESAAITQSIVDVVKKEPKLASSCQITS